MERGEGGGGGGVWVVRADEPTQSDAPPLMAVGCWPFLLPFLQCQALVAHRTNRVPAMEDTAAPEVRVTPANRLAVNPIPLYYPNSPCKKAIPCHRWRECHVTAKPGCG